MPSRYTVLDSHDPHDQAIPLRSLRTPATAAGAAPSATAASSHYPSSSETASSPALAPLLSDADAEGNGNAHSHSRSHTHTTTSGRRSHGLKRLVRAALACLPTRLRASRLVLILGFLSLPLFLPARRPRAGYALPAPPSCVSELALEVDMVSVLCPGAGMCVSVELE